MYVAAETPVIPLGDGADSEAEIAGMGGISGGVSGPGSLSLAGGAVAWRQALRSAVMLGVPAGVLCSGLTPFGQSLGLV
jgi:hypothetical protein